MNTAEDLLNYSSVLFPLGLLMSQYLIMNRFNLSCKGNSPLHCEFMSIACSVNWKFSCRVCAQLNPFCDIGDANSLNAKQLTIFTHVTFGYRAEIQPFKPGFIFLRCEVSGINSRDIIGVLIIGVVLLLLWYCWWWNNGQWGWGDYLYLADHFILNWYYFSWRAYFSWWAQKILLEKISNLSVALCIRFEDFLCIILTVMRRHFVNGNRKLVRRSPPRHYTTPHGTPRHQNLCILTIKMHSRGSIMFFLTPRHQIVCLLSL